MTSDAGGPARSAGPLSAAAGPQSFADRQGTLWLDGSHVPWREARTHVLTHALHYASSVFEGARAYDGQIFRLDDHTHRLFDSARLLELAMPCTPAELSAICREALARSGLEDAYIRPVAFRGPERMGISGRDTTTHLAVATWKWGGYFPIEDRMKGINLTQATWRRPGPDTVPYRAKAAGMYMICTLAKNAAERDGYADALMLDYRGYVAETTGANVFFVRDGVLHTPLPDCFLDGITRRTVIGLARARGLTVLERHISPLELATFSECFVTGTAAEVTPVAGVAGIEYCPGQISATLMDDYAKQVRART